MGIYWSRTDDEEIFVATNDSTFWAALATPFILAFGLLLVFLDTAASLIENHPIMVLVIYIFISAIIGYFLYIGRGLKRSLCGVIGTVLTMLPIGVLEGSRLIPSAANSGSFGSVFSWIIITVFVGGLTVFALALSRFIKNGFAHLVV